MLRCWDVEQQRGTAELKGHKAPALALVASYGDSLWSGGEDCTVRVWDLPSGRPVVALSQHRGAVTCLANVGDFVLSGSQDATICMWDSRSHQCIHSLASHQGPVHCLGWVAAAVKYTFWSTSSDRHIRRWTFEVTGASLERDASVRLGLQHLDREGEIRPAVPALGPSKGEMEQLEREHAETCKRYLAEIKELKEQKALFDAKLQQTTALFDAIQSQSEGLKQDFEAELRQVRGQLGERDAEVARLAAALREAQAAHAARPAPDELQRHAEAAREAQTRAEQLAATVKALKLENERLQSGLARYANDPTIGRDADDIYHILNTRTGLVQHIGELQHLANASRRRLVQSYELPALRLAPVHVREAVLQQLNAVALAFDDVVDKGRLLAAQFLTEGERASLPAPKAAPAAPAPRGS
eukprot:EG_transcript_13715